jgi:peroxiredoxin
MVLAIGPADDLEYLEAFRDELGLTMPVLYDENAKAHNAYQVQQAYEDTYYPQDFLIDPEGRVAYVSNTYEPERLQELIEEMLSP